MKKLLVCLLALLLITGMVTGCGNNNAVTPVETDKVTQGGTDGDTIYHATGAHANAPTHPYQIGMTKFAELLEEKSEGRIIMDVFHSSQLGNERDLVEGMQLGTVDVAPITSGPLSGFTDAYLVFDLPFLIGNVAEARMLCDSPLGDEILASLNNDGVMGLSYFENGMRSITNNVRPIEKPEDLKGIKIRTMENPMHMEAFKVMGADPTPMAFSELFTALQQGAMDAQENPYIVIANNNFQEVQKYLSVTEHLYSPAPLLMSKTFYDSLPEDLQAVVHEAALEAGAYQRAACDEQEAKLIEELQADGMEINFPDKAPFVEATKSLYDTYVGDKPGLVSPEIYNAAVELLK